MSLPWRGSAESPDRPRELPLPPARMPLRRHGRWRKRWRYVAAFGPEVMLCAGVARVGPATQAWWAVWDREEGSLRERTAFVATQRTVRLEPGRVWVRDGDLAIDLVLDETAGVETVCPHGGDGYVWTRKQAAVPVRGTVRRGERELRLDALAVIDDTAGYHARHTAWRWSAGVGRLEDGATVGWNLVEGINDPPARSERSLWVDGVAREVGPVAFAADLRSVRFAEEGELRCGHEAMRERHDELLVLRSDYRQPFGTFTGTLPGGARLAQGFGVMEDHVARW